MKNQEELMLEELAQEERNNNQIELEPREIREKEIKTSMNEVRESILESRLK